MKVPRAGARLTHRDERYARSSVSSLSFLKRRLLRDIPSVLCRYGIHMDETCVSMKFASTRGGAPGPRPLRHASSGNSFVNVPIASRSLVVRLC
jgi:hypothetical protein